MEVKGRKEILARWGESQAGRVQYKAFLDNQRRAVYERGVLGPLTSEDLTRIPMLSHRGDSR
jgi:hypothetical protein